MIVGIDEVGRGAWAGPLCIAAVALGETELPGLTDSKKLSAKKRQEYDHAIKRQAPLVGIGWVSARDLDRIGMSEALKLAARRAMAQIDSPSVSQIIIDGTIMLLDDSRAITMKQADLLVPSVSAASIIAKVARDSYMAQVGSLFEEYGFATHVGYGTSKHMAALEAVGPSPLHRMSFAPLKAARTTPTKSVSVPTDGAIAETQTTVYLQQQGFTILERNWKTKWCEIDIIGLKDDRVHFVEVKYRRSSRFGDGLSAITPRKMKQMRFAAELWLSNRNYDSATLSVASLSGDHFKIDELFDITT